MNMTILCSVWCRCDRRDASFPCFKVHHYSYVWCTGVSPNASFHSPLKYLWCYFLILLVSFHWHFLWIPLTSPFNLPGLSYPFHILFGSPDTPSPLSCTVKLVCQQLFLTVASVVVTSITTRLARDPHATPLSSHMTTFLHLVSACLCLNNYRSLIMPAPWQVRSFLLYGVSVGHLFIWGKVIWATKHWNCVEFIIIFSDLSQDMLFRDLFLLFLHLRNVTS